MKPSVVLVLLRVTPSLFSKQLTSLVLLLLLTGLLKRVNYFVSSICSCLAENGNYSALVVANVNDLVLTLGQSFDSSV